MTKLERVFTMNSLFDDMADAMTRRDWRAFDAALLAFREHDETLKGDPRQAEQAAGADDEQG